jgi:hemerythrin superfamily protein
MSSISFLNKMRVAGRHAGPLHRAWGRAVPAAGSGKRHAAAPDGPAPGLPCRITNFIHHQESQHMPATQSSSTARLIPPPTRRSGTPPPKGEKTAANTAPKKASPPDAVDLLVDDHLAVDACFKRYEKLAKSEAPASERHALAMEICKMLTAHTQVEEEIFYPALREAGIDADLLDEAQVEHNSAKQMIAELQAGQPDDDLYDAKVQVLGEYVSHHVLEEHTEMFPKCRRVAALDLEALRERMAARKAEIEAAA